MGGSEEGSFLRLIDFFHSTLGWYHSTLGSNVIKKKKSNGPFCEGDCVDWGGGGTPAV